MLSTATASGFGLTYTYYTLWQTNFTIPPPIVFYVLGSVSTTYSRDIVHHTAAPTLQKSLEKLLQRRKPPQLHKPMLPVVGFSF